SSSSSTMPFPHTLPESAQSPPSQPPSPGSVQSLAQPSPSTRFPSSHSSSESTTPSPHAGSRQVDRHASGAASEFAAPSSHSSPPSMIPFPHAAGTLQPLPKSPLTPSRPSSS